MWSPRRSYPQNDIYDDTLHEEVDGSHEEGSREPPVLRPNQKLVVPGGTGRERYSFRLQADTCAGICHLFMPFWMGGGSVCVFIFWKLSRKSAVWLDGRKGGVKWQIYGRHWWRHWSLADDCDVTAFVWMANCSVSLSTCVEGEYLPLLYVYVL